MKPYVPPPRIRPQLVALMNYYSGSRLEALNAQIAAMRGRWDAWFAANPHRDFFMEACPAAETPDGRPDHIVVVVRYGSDGKQSHIGPQSKFGTAALLARYRKLDELSQECVCKILSACWLADDQIALDGEAAPDDKTEPWWWDKIITHIETHERVYREEQDQ